MSDTKQTIQTFYQQAAQKDFARNFSFRVLAITNPFISIAESDLVYCKAAALPARAITNVAIPYMGLDFNIAGSAKYPGSEGYNLEFYVDAKSSLRQKFEDWSRATFDDQTSTGNFATAPATSTMDLIQLDQQLNRISQYRLVGVGVRNVGELAYDMSGNGEQVSFTVTLAYHFFQRTFDVNATNNSKF